MSLRKLIPMTDFVNQILAYTKESNNYQRGIQLIDWYAELIQQPISMEMFKGDNPLFPNFKIVESQKEATENNYKNAIWYFGNGEFATTLYRKSEHSTTKSGMCFITSFHLSTIEQLCDKDIDFSMLSEYAESDIFD